MNRLMSVAMVAACVLDIGTIRAQSAEPPALANPIVILVRDAAIRKELGLTITQIQSLEALLTELNEPLFALRNVYSQIYIVAFW
jgi:hypothetical protein